jgi:sulfatase maturation enzyme AslB (radical SAM superfamily)
MNLSILYRGPLSSCNYGCDYCPFAKTKNTRAELEDDARKLERFVLWIEQHPQHHFGILFTPWGEALIRRHYQRAITRLSHLPNVQKVAIQTNLSCTTKWLDNVNKNKTALWTTYHPSEITRESFLGKCKTLDAMKVRYSVGMVGFRELFDEIRQVRSGLPQHVYLWVNANKRQQDYYSQQDIEALQQIDHLFEYNTKYYASKGRTCRAGHTVFSVDGDGNMSRCHFIKSRIGNIYETDFERKLSPGLCTNETCGCHIGYVHMNDLGLYETFRDGVLERIPVGYGT